MLAKVYFTNRHGDNLGVWDLLPPDVETLCKFIIAAADNRADEAIHMRIDIAFPDPTNKPITWKDL